MNNGPPGETPKTSRSRVELEAEVQDLKARCSQLRDLTKARGEEIARLRTELDHALADAARYQAAFEACMGVKP